MKNNPKNVLQSTTLSIPGLKDEVIEISFERITPEIAKAWLEANEKRQRPINNRSVEQYASQMEKGMWEYANGDAIRFDEEGLADGQHRLSGIVESEKSAIMLVMRGLKSSAMRTMDQGKKRNMVDIMRIGGFKPPVGLNNGVLASVVGGIYAVRYYASEKRPDAKSHRVDRVRGSVGSSVELYNFLESNPEIVGRLRKLSKYNLSAVKENSTLAGTIIGWYICDVINPEVADQIMKTMEEARPCTTLGRNCPAFRLFGHQVKARSNKATISKHQYAANWLWALDNIVKDKPQTRYALQKIHMPGQGHIGTDELVDYMKNLVVIR